MLPRFLEPAIRNPHLGVVMIMIALVMTGNGLVAPILSVYAATFAASSTMVGLVITLFGVGRLMANMPAGFLSQRFGRRPLMILGPAVIVAGSIGAALAQDFTALLVWRFVQGIGSGIYMTTSSALMADLSSPKDRGPVMALYQAALLLGSGIGPAVGGLIAEHFGLAAPFWAYASVCALALLAAVTANDWPQKEQTEKPAPAEHGPAAPDTGLLRNPLFLMICLVNLGVFFTRTASQWQLIPLLGYDGYGLGLDTIGAALATTAICNFLMLPMVGGLIQRFGARRITIWSSWLTALSLVVIAAGPVIGAGMEGFWLGVVLLGMGSGLNGPAVVTFAADVMPRHLYGPAMGLLRSSGDIGFVAGPIVAGFLLDFGAAGYAGGLVFNALLVFATALAFGAGSSRSRMDAPAE